MFTINLWACHHCQRHQSIKDYASSKLKQSNLFKKLTVVRQKVLVLSTRSAMLGWGRTSPLRRMRWSSRQIKMMCVAINKVLNVCVAINKVLLVGKALVSTARRLYTSAAP